MTHSKVDGCDAVHDDEDVGVGQLGEAEVQAHREHEHQQLQVKVERRPGSCQTSLLRQFKSYQKKI